MPAGTSARGWAGLQNRRGAGHTPRAVPATASSSAASVSGSAEGTQQRAARKALAQALSAGADLLALLAPRLADRLQHLRPRRHPGARLGWEVRAAVERQLLGREKHVQRPAPMAGHALHGLHVQGIDVRALLAVHLHAHEQLVHQRGGALVGERLALHHVAPVAGRIPDRHQQGSVLLACARQRHGSPRQPVNGIVGVLAQVGRGLCRERVRHSASLPACRPCALRTEAGSAGGGGRYPPRAALRSARGPPAAPRTCELSGCAPGPEAGRRACERATRRPRQRRARAGPWRSPRRSSFRRASR